MLLKRYGFTIVDAERIRIGLCRNGRVIACLHAGPVEGHSCIGGYRSVDVKVPYALVGPGHIDVPFAVRGHRRVDLFRVRRRIVHPDIIGQEGHTAVVRHGEVYVPVGGGHGGPFILEHDVELIVGADTDVRVVLVPKTNPDNTPLLSS